MFRNLHTRIVIKNVLRLSFETVTNKDVPLPKKESVRLVDEDHYKERNWRQNLNLLNTLLKTTFKWHSVRPTLKWLSSEFNNSIFFTPTILSRKPPGGSGGPSSVEYIKVLSHERIKNKS